MPTFIYRVADIRPAVVVTIGMFLSTFLLLASLTLIVGGMDLTWVSSIHH
jgi:hypothetical protein